MKFCANVSIVFKEVPLPERFARAKEAGFSAVEFWWPMGEDLEEVERAIKDAGLEVALFNFDAGDMPAGDRGLVSNPDRVEQLQLARETVGWAADQAAGQGAEVMIEAVNTFENGPYLLYTTEEAAEFVESIGRDNVKLQYDFYHMQRMEGNLSVNV